MIDRTAPPLYWNIYFNIYCKLKEVDAGEERRKGNKIKVK